MNTMPEHQQFGLFMVFALFICFALPVIVAAVYDSYRDYTKTKTDKTREFYVNEIN